MTDPLSSSKRSEFLQDSSKDDPNTHRIKQLWSQIFHGSTYSSLDQLKSYGLNGKITTSQGPTLRWIYWLVFLYDQLSSTPSSWTAVLDKDRWQYVELRRDFLRAPDGNFPRDVGLEDDHLQDESLPCSSAIKLTAAIQDPLTTATSTSSTTTNTNNNTINASFSAASSYPYPFPFPSSTPSSGHLPRSYSTRSSLSRATSSSLNPKINPTIIRDLSVNNPLSLDESNPWKDHYASLELRQTIALDVERTFPDIDYFRDPSIQKALTNALFVWCKQNQHVGYRQGMHELMAVLWIARQTDAIPLSTSFNNHSGNSDHNALLKSILGDRWIEHDVYTVFCLVMKSAKSWYEWRETPISTSQADGAPLSGPLSPSLSSPTNNHAKVPIVQRCEHIRTLLHTADPALAQHLDALEIEPQLFALRWIRLIFTREFATSDALVLWDALFASDPSLQLVDYICLAMLIRVRNQLLAADYSSALQVLLRYPVKPTGNRTELLVQQALYLCKNGADPASGVALMMQNRDLLDIQPRGIPNTTTITPSTSNRGNLDMADRPGAFAGISAAAAPSSSSSSSSSSGYQTTYPSRTPRFATVGRTTSSQYIHNSGVPARQRPSISQQPPLPNNTFGSRVADPLGAVSSTYPPLRSFLPEGLSDFARGLYERGDSLGINQALNTTLVNVSRSVATAAAAGVAAASSAGPGNIGSGGFPSSIDPPLLASAATTNDLGQPSATVSPPPPSTPTASLSSLNTSAGSLAAPTNKTIGEALSTCIQVLESSWLASQNTSNCGANVSASTSSAELNQNDINTLMSFTALKHIRDVLTGSAQEFDPATLPLLSGRIATAETAVVSPSSPSPSPTSSPSVPIHPTPDPLPPSLNTHDESVSTTADKEDPTAKASESNIDPPSHNLDESTTTSLPPAAPDGLHMSLPEYERYGRQLILPSFGITGQLALRRSHVVIVGAGGLGCPALQYLAAAGVGQISVIDGDVVEKSNLARQILHNDSRVGISKAISAAESARIINPYIRVNAISTALTPSNAVSLFRGANIVLDCTDSPSSRYLINDAAVLCGIPVVSGAAQGLDGQLVILHQRIHSSLTGPKDRNDDTGIDKRGPCYRCLFPISPTPNDVTNCEDGGILGPITGVIGTIQAIETIKLLVYPFQMSLQRPCLFLFNPISFNSTTTPTTTTTTPFRTVLLRPRKIETCRSCSTTSNTISKISNLELENYTLFCGLVSPTSALEKSQHRISLPSFQKHLTLKNSSSVIIDVRPVHEFQICSLPNSINIPLSKIISHPETIVTLIPTTPTTTIIIIICKRGNDSQIAVEKLLHHFQIHTVDVIGGLRGYSKRINPKFPIY